ncbi:MAG: flagellar basal body rod protein FlgC [Pseudomonadota bacterium]
MEAIQISMSALDVEWQRLQIIAQNLANMNTTRMADGNIFQPLRLVSGPDINFDALMTGERTPEDPAGVHVLGVEAVQNSSRTVFDPNHPHADENGVVTYPNVDHAAEMTLMIKTSRVYEANLTVMSLAEQMYRSALEAGR